MGLRFFNTTFVQGWYFHAHGFKGPLHQASLLAHYGELHWRPARTPYEVMVGAVLTQNTASSNVEKAIANFWDNLSPEAVAGADLAELTETIRPAGFFNLSFAPFGTRNSNSFSCPLSTYQQMPPKAI